MRAFFKSLICIGITNLILTNMATAQETGFTYIERELHYLMTIWPGDYDNQEQVTLDARALGIKEETQPRFHTFVSVAEIPDLGEQVLYIEKHKNSDPKDIYQQHLYVLSADEEQRAVRATVYAFKKSGEFQKPYGHDNTPVKINKRAIKKLEGCDFLIHRDGYAFSGSMQPQSCNNETNEGFLEQHIRISDTEFSFQERRVDRSGKVLSALADFRPRVMRKARWFACMVDVPKDIPGRSNHTQHYIKMHDQGGAFKFIHPDGRELTLLMRNTWSYGMQRDSFVIVVLDKEGRTLVYAWGSPEADRIGVNPGYVRIQCDLDTPSMVKLQNELRTDS